MARVNRQRGALFRNARHTGDIREVELRVHALGVHVERHCHDIHVAAAFTIAEQAAFHTIRARHHRELCRGHAGATVVVRVHRQHDVFARHQVAVHPFDLVGKHVGRGVFHRRRQVDDDLAVRPHAPGFDGRLAGLQRHLQLSAAEGLGRILQGPLRFGVRIRAHLEVRDMVLHQLHHLRHIHVENDLAPCRRHRVIDVHDGALGALHCFHRAVNQVLA
ncbi:hypothetical protein SDC9_75705 [bioreactor metagenome]|uniref:Uncharacterized protein n=1 Tax=bioreactor metagenome TaxID=1076179 RepID=A0A644YKQ8_9ZZZZ